MAARIGSSTGYAEAVIFVGERLNLVYYIESGGSVVTFTGNDITTELFNASKELIATPTATLSSFTDPETGTVTANAIITISDIPANLPTRQGDYMLVVKRTSQSDPTNTEYSLRVRCKFMHPAFDL